MEEIKEYKIINATVSDPAGSMFKSSRSDVAVSKVLTCNNSENCQLYARGECAQLALLSSINCPYGKRSIERGFTKRARNYRSWISERKTKYKDYLHKLGTYKTKMAVVGDYIFLPYAHMNMDERIPFLSKGGFMLNGSNFIHMEMFTPKVVVQIITARPIALMGGEITSYQKDVVPVFIKHLQETMPDMFAAVAEIHPAINDRIAEYTYVGRNAYVHSLKPGTVVHKYHNTNNIATQNWLWDGEYLTSTNTSLSFPIVSYDEIEIRIKPKANETVQISDENQVDENTKFST